MNSLVAADLITRATARLQFDEKQTAREILRELVKLEARGIISSRHAALRRVARLAPEPLRGELFAQVGLRLAGDTTAAAS